MKIIVAMRQIADLVEELEVDGSGTDIDREFIKFVSNEWDEAALEEALCLKEAYGGEITVVGLDEVDFDQSLYGALAKGADRAVKFTGDFESWTSTKKRAGIIASWLKDEEFDLLLTGVQAADDLDGQLAGVLAAHLGVAHAAVVVGVESDGSKIKITQEVGGGVTITTLADTPIVLGIQAARQAPRYVPISRIKAAMTSGGIKEISAQEETSIKGPKVLRLFAPVSQSHATMLTGKPAEVAQQIVDLIRSKGLINS